MESSTNNNQNKDEEMETIKSLLVQKKAVFMKLLDIEQRRTVRQPTTLGEILEKCPLPELNVSTEMTAENIIKNHHMLQKLKLYQFCGISVTHYKSTEVVFKFSVATNGRYCQSYFMNVVRNVPENDYNILKYHLPYNIKMDKLLKEMPITTFITLKTFVRNIQRSCEAFHYRLQQFEDLKKLSTDKKLGINIFFTHDCGYAKIHFNLDYDSTKTLAVTFHLMYQYNEVLPSKMVLECDGCDKDIQSELETRFNIFENLRLDEAMKVVAIKRQQSTSEESTTQKRDSSTSEHDSVASSSSSAGSRHQTKEEKKSANIMLKRTVTSNSQTSVERIHDKSHSASKGGVFLDNVNSIKRNLFQTNLLDNNYFRKNNESITSQKDQDSAKTASSNVSSVDEKNKHENIFLDDNKEEHSTTWPKNGMNRTPLSTRKRPRHSRNVARRGTPFK